MYYMLNISIDVTNDKDGPLHTWTFTERRIKKKTKWYLLQGNQNFP